MVVKPGQRGTRNVNQWGSLLQRGLDTVNEVSDLAAQRFGALMDPRARLLRQRRRALRWGLVFTALTLFWIGTTALLASWSTPWWGLLVTAIFATVGAFFATLLLLRFRWLRSAPLPAQRPGVMRRLPPPGSAARAHMTALAASERGFFSLLGVMERANLLPEYEIRELSAAANQTASTMAATANEVASMERTVRFSPHSRSYLQPTVDAFAAQLHQGVRQYNEMVTAAAQLVSAANAGATMSSPMSRQRYRDELTGATDRLVGWAQAFDELGKLRA